jgi:hypothetical protein
MQPIRRGRFEIEVAAEGFRIIVFGVNQDHPCTDLVGRRDCSSQGVFGRAVSSPWRCSRGIPHLPTWRLARRALAYDGGIILTYLLAHLERSS